MSQPMSSMARQFRLNRSSAARRLEEPTTGLITPEWAVGTRGWSQNPGKDWVQAEVARCLVDPVYFIGTYTSIYAAADMRPDLIDTDPEIKGLSFADMDPTSVAGKWVKFDLWPDQERAIRLLHMSRCFVLLKARQLGATWFSLGHNLHEMLFIDGATELLFSRRDQEAIKMLTRMKDMFRRLPPWLIPDGSFNHRGQLTGAAGHIWTMPNGSQAMSFPTGTGDSYSATTAVIDEADLILDLAAQLGSVKPTVDNGGRLVLLSRVDKKKPNSAFKSIYKGARAGKTRFKHYFMPWYAHPGRTAKFYEEQVAFSLSTTFSLDWVREQYPATDDEALMANELDKRFPQMVVKPLFAPMESLSARTPLVTAVWFETAEGDPVIAPDPRNYTPADSQSLFLRDLDDWKRRMLRPVDWVEPCEKGHPRYAEYLAFQAVAASATCFRKKSAAPLIPGLRIYRLPVACGWYTLGADPAQGMPTSNDSAAVVTDDRTGEEVASFEGKHAPKVFARYCAMLSDWFRSPSEAKSQVMVEQNNHGHAFLVWWQENRMAEDYRSTLLLGPNNEKGWTQTGKSKETMWHRLAQRITDKKLLLHTQKLYDQVVSIESETLEAPEGDLDDMAVALGLSVAGADMRPKSDWKVKSYG